MQVNLAFSWKSLKKHEFRDMSGLTEMIFNATNDDQRSLLQILSIIIRPGGLSLSQQKHLLVIGVSGAYLENDELYAAERDIYPLSGSTVFKTCQ